MAQTEGGDGGLGAQRGLVVAVPADAVAPVPVQVAQQRVEAAAAALGHDHKEVPQRGRPLQQQQRGGDSGNSWGGSARSVGGRDQSNLRVGGQAGAGVRVGKLPEPAGQPGLSIRLTWGGGKQEEERDEGVWDVFWCLWGNSEEKLTLPVVGLLRPGKFCQQLPEEAVSLFWGKKAWNQQQSAPRTRTGRKCSINTKEL